MKYTMRKPCDNCPFRNDGKGVSLGGDRAQEIADSLVRSDFPCHKTIDYSEDGEGQETEATQHCAGALIMLEKAEQPSQMMRIVERLGLYNRTELDMNAPVYDDPDEFVDVSYDMNGE